jgi:hypothetical protein
MAANWVYHAVAGASLGEDSMSTFYIKTGDTSPAIRYAVEPSSVVLTGASVRFQMRQRRSRGGATLIDASAVVVIATGTPTFEYQWEAADTANAGTFEAEFQVTYSNGRIETFPNDGFISIKVSEDIR